MTLLRFRPPPHTQAVAAACEAGGGYGPVGKTLVRSHVCAASRELSSAPIGQDS